MMLFVEPVEDQLFSGDQMEFLGYLLVYKFFISCRVVSLDSAQGWGCAREGDWGRLSAQGSSWGEGESCFRTASSRSAPLFSPTCTSGVSGSSACSLERDVGIIRGEHITGSPMWPRSGGLRTGDPNAGLQDWLGQDLQLTLWLLRRETQFKSPGRPHGSAGAVMLLLILFLGIEVFLELSAP